MLATHSTVWFLRPSANPEVKASLIGLQSGGGATAAMLGALVPLCCSRTWRTKILWPSLATLPLSLAVQGLATESSGLLTSWDVHLRFGLDQKDGQKAQVVPHTSGINWVLSRPGISRLQRGPVLMPASGLLLASGSPEKEQRRQAKGSVGVAGC